MNSKKKKKEMLRGVLYPEAHNNEFKKKYEHINKLLG